MKSTIKWILIIVFMGFIGCKKPIEHAQETQNIQNVL